MIEYKLRSIEDADHLFLVDLHNDPIVLNNLTHPEPVSLVNHMTWWKKICTDQKQLRLIFTIDGKAAGLVKFYDIDQTNQCCNLGADIHKDYRGQGHAYHMWKLMLDMAFMNLGLHRVGLTTAEYNDVAQHVYKKLGFVEEGRLHQSLRRDGKRYDQVCMYMLKNDWLSLRGG